MIAPSAGVGIDAVKLGSDPVAPATKREYSPEVATAARTRAKYVPAAAAVCDSDAFRPSAAELSSAASRLPDGWYNSTSGSRLFANSPGPSAGVLVLRDSASPGLTAKA